MESCEESQKRTQKRYRQVAAGEAGQAYHPDPVAYATSIGYSSQELESVPEAAVVCHGCANPTALAELKDGEAVLDLGCGGGLDAFLAAQRVGQRGRVIGVDVTPEMIEKATENARKSNYKNVEFRHAAIERLPLGDYEVDVAISNCVMNHCSDKLAVFKEVFRVLKLGGRLCVADLVVRGRFGEEILKDEVWGTWIAGALTKDQYLKAIGGAGFRDIMVTSETAFAMSEKDERLRGRIISIQLRAFK